ncbi:TPA: hypothetical protein ACH3X2_011614 [Trebouxia sp. C0005]
MPSSKSTAGLRCGADISCSISALSFPLQMPEEDIMADSRQAGAADMEQLVSPFRFCHSQAPVCTPMSDWPPRREDTTLENGGMARWSSPAQDKAVDSATSTNQRAAGVAEQTSTLL